MDIKTRVINCCVSTPALEAQKDVTKEDTLFELFLISYDDRPPFLSSSSQVAVEERIRQLHEAHRDFGPASQHFLSSKSLSAFIA